MALTGLASTLLNPLGYGYYGFYGAVQRFGLWSMGWLSDRLPLNFSEMTSIIEELSNVSTKSTLLDFSVVLGWGFLVLLWRAGTLINLKDPRARVAFVYMLITSLSTSGNLSILFFLGLIIVIRLYPSTHGLVIEPERPSVRPAPVRHFSS